MELVTIITAYKDITHFFMRSSCLKIILKLDVLFSCTDARAHWKLKARSCRCFNNFVEFMGCKESPCRPGVGNLSLDAGQKQTLQGMAGRTNFPPTIRSLCCSWLILLTLGNLWNF